jgi:hypothetical protein
VRETAIGISGLRSVICGALIGIPLPVCSAAADAGNSFTVRDSIEIGRFSDPSTRDPAARIKYSTDTTHFLVVTTRGLVDTDQVESTLWLFDTASVRSFLTATPATNPPLPIPLVRFQGRLESEQDDSYDSLITSACWSADSRCIFYLGEVREGD